MSGLQTLMDAERQAQEIITVARQQKSLMVKKAREEAQEEVRRFREEREDQYRKYVMQFKGATEDYTGKLRLMTEKELEGIKRHADQTGDQVVKLLLDSVFEAAK